MDEFRGSEHNTIATTALTSLRLAIHTRQRLLLFMWYIPDFLGLLLGARPPVRPLAVSAADGPDGSGLVALVRVDRLVLHHLVVPQRPEPAHLEHGLKERQILCFWIAFT